MKLNHVKKFLAALYIFCTIISLKSGTKFNHLANVVCVQTVVIKTQNATTKDLRKVFLNFLKHKVLNFVGSSERTVESYVSLN